MSEQADTGSAKAENDGGDAGAQTALDFEKLKSGGVIKQKQKNMFTVRLQAPGGRLPLAKLKKIVEAAEKYGGSDYVHLSIRQSVEIPYVNFRDIGALQEELDEVKQAVASCGARVRVPTACSGCEYNPNGLVDTQQLARMVHERYFGQDTPHKFKVNLSGCPIDCARTSEADLGFQGAIFPHWNEESCIKCTICEKACREGAIVCDEEGAPVFDAAKCLACADCIRNCPTESWAAHQRGLIVRVGGKHGRHPLNASVVAMFLPEELVPQAIEGTVAWYRGNSPEGKRIRLGDVLRQTGMQSYMQHMEPVFGEYAVTNPAVPEPVVIHPQGGVSQ